MAKSLRPLARASGGDLRAEMKALRADLRRLGEEMAHMRSHAAMLESLAHEDPLTGMLNRRGFLQEVVRALAYGTRYNTPVALFLVDLDRFKPINDTYGHAIGDAALSHFATVLKQNVRASDSIGRLGGDEFALILWQLDEQTARHKAGALQTAIAATPLVTDGFELCLSASIGVAMLEASDGPQDILARADKAMYSDKSERRALRR